MALKLYEITEEIEALDGLIDSWASNHEGDLSEFPLDGELERLEGERTEKLLNLAVWYKSLTAEANAFKDELRRLQGRQKALNNKAERVKSYLDYSLTTGEKISDTRVALNWRSSEKLIVECMLDALPEEFIETKISARLADLKRAVKGGQDFEGVHIEKYNNLQIQ